MLNAARGAGGSRGAASVRCRDGEPSLRGSSDRPGGARVPGPGDPRRRDRPRRRGGPRDRQALTELGGLLRTGRYTADAAAAIVVAHERESRFGVSDASRAIQSMILTAGGGGVASNWAGFGGLEGVREHVGLLDTYDVLAVVPLGYPARAIGRGTKNRKPLGE